MPDSAEASPALSLATIRLARPGDIEALGAVTGRAYAAAYSGIVPRAVLDEWIAGAPAMWQRWRDAIEERPPDHPSRAWVAERDGVILGYATTSPATSEYLPPPDGAGELTNLYLDPAAIGTGVGQQLYDHAVRDLRARRFNPLVVWAFRDNPKAQRFYRHMGLTIDVPDHDWVLGGVPCALVRFRGDWPPDGSSGWMSGGLAAWLLGQRWFRSKQRPIGSVSERDRAPLGDAALVILEVAYADGGAPDLYLVPSVDGREPRDGEGAWAAIVQAMADGAELRSSHGTFTCSRTDALEELLPSASVSAAALRERRLGVEQSNTSVVLDDRLILKLYRLLEPGVNPDLEVSLFLADAGFADTPATAGAMTWSPDGGEPSAAAMLQAFVPSTGDAWAAMLARLSEDPERAREMVARIGEVTARMHAALASRPPDPAFPARVATVPETAAWRASAEQQLALAVSAVDGDAHDRMVALAPAVTARFADTFGSASGEAMVSRIHGDYHLGQLLARTDGGFSVIDFEGEPARPLHERRAPSSPLRDVAGMLRSLDYAARTAERTSAVFDADGWLAAARGSFIGAYGGIGPSELVLLEAFELEKACYEVRYEASNRPDWLWLPLAAVERLSMDRGARVDGPGTLPA